MALLRVEPVFGTIIPKRVRGRLLWLLPLLFRRPRRRRGRHPHPEWVALPRHRGAVVRLHRRHLPLLLVRDLLMLDRRLDIVHRALVRRLLVPGRAGYRHVHTESEAHVVLLLMREVYR